ncbi:LamG-like jellyroll fold domain-containing protein [Winogradskyella ouciana]|uniref:T9SS type A sorting domain-containing protein n=1 Tax=Winogradskyella ouciana TaxID=2608631 RepID=A0A7K1GBL7_9FLAO|nr:LamG-like jellyroll fold domain-containing protein [Winogradskyella ouciana]MTE26690.1 T9SS type A sorting domain-containing protein [Winogradskyella ouciana]
MLLNTNLRLVSLLIFCTISLTINSQDWNEILKQTASDAAAGDQYGISVAMDGNYAIVGASTSDTNGSDSGAAYILIRSSAGNWTEQAKLTASDAAAGDNFGFSVSVSGKYAIVGAFGKDSNGIDAGAAYVFIRNGTTWTEEAILTASDGSTQDQFGVSVSISGNSAVIGAFAVDDVNGVGSNFGAAYVFNRSGTVWSEQTKLTASDAAPTDQFGFSVDISGDYVIVGAEEDDDVFTDSGSAYIFLRSGTSWSEQAKLTASDADTQDNFGRSVAIDGIYAIVGSYLDDDELDINNTNSGSAYTFVRSGTNWSEQDKLIPSNPETDAYFGWSVDIDCNYAIVGARLDGGVTESGSTYLYERSGITWAEINNFIASDAEPVDRFGTSVAIDGAYAMVGATNEDEAGNNAGALYVFEQDLPVDIPNWNEIINVAASDPEENAQFGNTVAINGDYAVIGAFQDDNTNGTLAGAAYVFVKSGSNWIEVAKLIASDGSANDRFGESVAIQDNHIFIGSSSNNFSSGAVYVFSNNGSNWVESQKLLASDIASGDIFGKNIDVHNNRLIVGAVSNDDAGNSSGSAYIYEFDGLNWLETIKLLPNDGQSGNAFGIEVAIEENIALVGAILDNNGVNKGSFYVFDYSMGSWSQTQKIVASDGESGDNFGRSIRISGETIVAGALNENTLGDFSGAAYVFKKENGNWAEKQKLLASDGSSSDRFGRRVDIYDDTIVIPAFFNNTVYIYKEIGSIWREVQLITNPNPGAGGFFASSVAIDGNYIITGVSGDDIVTNAEGSAYFFQQTTIFPDIDNLPELTAECELTPTAPTANSGAITATADTTFPITAQGTTVVTWTYDDGNWNTDTQTQNVIIDDNTGPSITCSNISVNSCTEVDLTIMPPVVSDNCVYINSALDFDGSNDLVSISNFPFLTDFTLEAWVNPIYIPNEGYRSIVSKGAVFDANTNFDFGIRRNWQTGIYTMYLYIQNGTTISGYALEIDDQANTWTHLVATFDDATKTVKLFQDGQILGSSVLSVSPTDGGQDLRIGHPATTDGQDEPFTGQIDEVRIWNRVLSETEIASSNSNLLSGSESGLEAYFNFDDGTGSSTLTDQSPNGRDGTLTNMDVNSDWITSLAGITPVSLTNNLTGTSDASGTFSVGETDIIWTATDVNGNSSTCTQIITISDTENPVINCAADVVVGNDPGECFATISIDSPTATDNCSSNNDFALSFDGIDDYVSLTKIVLNTGLTYQAWIKTSSTANSSGYGGNSALNILGDRTNNVWNSFGITNGILEYHHFTGSWQVISASQPINDDQWHHVAVTHNQSTDVVTLYIDGIEVNSSTIGYADGGGFGKVGIDAVGGSFSASNDAGDLFEGELDEVRIWDKALTDEEIYNTYNKALVGDEIGLVVYFDFEDGPNSTILTDKTSNNNTGTLTNMDVSNDWVVSTAIPSITLTNNFNATSDASGQYPVGETEIIWTATDANNNSSTCTQMVTVNGSGSFELIWNGSVSNDWSDPTNWIPNEVPTECTDITIETAPNAPLLTGVTTIRDLNINPGSSVTVPIGATLNVSGDLELFSQSNSFSGIITEGTLSVSGSAKYNRYVNSNANGKDLISPPLSGQSWTDFLNSGTNATDLLDDGNTSPTTYLFGPFDKSTETYLTYSDATVATLTAGTGYRAATDSGSTLTFTGNVPSGDISVNIDYSGTIYPDWNLIGNPYPSYIHIGDFLNQETATPGKTNIDIFFPNSGIYAYAGRTTAPDPDGPVWDVITVANAGGRLMAPGQAFLVPADTDDSITTDLLFNESMQRAGSDDDFIAGRDTSNLTFLDIMISTQSKWFNTEFYFNDNASQGADHGYDATLLGNFAPSFAIYSQFVQDNTGLPIALQALHPSDLSNVSIPLGVNANQGEQLTFSIRETTLPNTVEVYLDDTLNNTSTLLNTSDYIITPITALSGTGRFFLRISEDTLSTVDDNLNQIHIYALPTSKELVVSGKLNGETKLNLYDMQGRNVKSTYLDHFTLENRIDISNINAGVYVASVKNESQQKSQMIILK